MAIDSDAARGFARFLIDPDAGEELLDDELEDDEAAALLGGALSVGVRRYVGIDRAVAAPLAAVGQWSDGQGGTLPRWLVEAVLRTGLAEPGLLRGLPPDVVADAVVAVLLELKTGQPLDERPLRESVEEVLSLARSGLAEVRSKPSAAER